MTRRRRGEEEEGEEEGTSTANVGGERNREGMLSEWLEGGEGLSLAVGALVAMEMRQAVLEGTGFTCSAGIAHNKVPS